VGAFRDGLRRLGWLDGRNLRVEYRWDAGSPARVRTYAAELVGQAPHAILVAGTPPLAVGGAGFGMGRRRLDKLKSSRRGTAKAFKGVSTIGARGMKPAILLVGADKGGVGKTTITRTVLDYLAGKTVLVRAFDTEYPHGTLKRFHPDITEVVDITSAPDQMRIIDTLATSEVKMNVIDVRAGLLAPTLQTFTDIGLFDAVGGGDFRFGLFHVLGPSVASLAEIAELFPYMKGKNYFILKNFFNESSYFDWHPEIYESYFEKLENQVPIVNIPKLNELAYEQVELAGVPFTSFIKNQYANGQPANYSLVLRGYVRTWLTQISQEYDRASALDWATAS
jgi:hypothetical protein